MKTLDQLVSLAVQKSARHQSSVQNGSELNFPLCWQLKALVIFILLGCGLLLIGVLSSRPTSGDPSYLRLVTILILVSLPLSILLLLPGRVAVDSAGIRQHFWWRRSKYIPWNHFASFIHDGNNGTTVVYGKFEDPIMFSAYLVDQARFDREVRDFSGTDALPDDI